MARMRFDAKDSTSKNPVGPFSPGASVVIHVKHPNGHYNEVQGVVAQVISDKQIVVNTAVGHLLANIADCKPRN